MPRPEAEVVRTETAAYRNAVETTVAGFTANDEDAGEFDDDVTEPLFLSLTSRLDRLATNVDTAAHRTAVVATRSLGVILAAMLVGVIVLFVVGARFQRRAEGRREAARLDARFRGIVENLQEFLLVVDDDGAVRYASPSVEAEFDAGRTSTDLLEWIAPGSHADLEQLLTALQPAEPVRLEALDPHGASRYFETVVSDQRENPDVAGLVITAREVTERVLLENRLRQQATTDDLTGLPNRRALNEASERAVARAHRNGSRVGLVLVDLDGFKGINDTMGHPVGDDLLIQVAHRLTSAKRSHELLARLGGDEFAVLLEDLSSGAEAETAARRMRDAVDAPYELGEQPIVIQASVGVAVVDDASGFEDLFRYADVALYKAKDRGRNQLVVYESGMDYLMQAEVRLRREMANGFGSGEFALAYQPLLDVGTGRPTGLEALMRWNSSALGPVSPAAFIPVAEHSGMIIKLGLWALRTACAQLVDWQRQGLADDLSMSVNVSVIQLQEPDFLDELTRIIDETGIAPSHLVLEVTESVLAQNPAEMVATLQRVRALGVQVALDDFGSGYSSMNQLQRLPVDEIKIDKEFIQAISNGDAGSRSMVDTLFALGRSMGLRTVAEGVEDLEQFEALAAQNCDVAQGYLFARPMPPSETFEFLRTFTSPIPHASTIE
jgi:diguanylate cyclase (GGDEF)-like protein/PAS domain S-box-containing protein